MLVYCADLWLNCQIDDVVDTVAEWLVYVRHVPVQPKSLRIDNFSFNKDGQRIQVARWDETWPRIETITYSHRDDEVNGRLWKTEIGIRQNDPENDVETTVVLSTEEISILVAPPEDQTRPIIVKNLLERCSPTEKTPGKAVIELNVENSPELLRQIERRDRRYPLVIVSPTSAKTYPVDPKSILFYVGGIADVVKIVPEANTYDIEEILGDRYAAWRGAINLIFPPINSGEAVFISTSRLKLEDIELMLAVPETAVPEKKLLSLVTHRVNLPNSWRRITPDHVNEQKRRYELAQLREAAKGSAELDAYIEAFDKNEQELQQEKSSLLEQLDQMKDELAARIEDINQLSDQIRIQGVTIEGLRTAFDYNRAGTAESTISGEARAAFIQVINQQASLEESLRLLVTLFPDRLVVLGSAFTSAHDSLKFERKATAFQLLFDLVTQYWEALHEGKGDVGARAIFGDAFAARESETVENSRRAIQLRTFIYKGKEIEMFKHLKIGVKDSVAETLRIHFYWDAEDQKVVIGHCGKHLDFK